MAMTVDRNRCPQNHKCPAIRVCPVGAISQAGVGLPVIDQVKCIKCEKCIKFCPMGAIRNA
ncbi:MAG: 4Fe-4S binding protein [Clostridia bacterium]